MNLIRLPTASASRAASRDLCAGLTSGAVPTICHVLHTMHVGGAEVLASRLAQRLGDRFRIVIACLDDVGPLGRELQAQGFPVHVVGRRPGLDWKCVFRLGAFLRGESVDLIHAHQYTPFLYASLARMLHRRLAPVLFLEHGRHQPDYPRRKRILANRILLRRRDRALGVGHAVRQALLDNEGLPPHRVDVVYNGIPLGKYHHVSEVHRDRVRDELGIARDALVVIQVARLDPIKDHATALRCFARVSRSLTNSIFLIVGDGPERTAIENHVSTLALSERVRLLGTRADVHRLLPASDIFLLTSTSEGIPLTVIEAMAARLPVVATCVGGVAEVVEDDVTGFLAPAGSDARLAEHILALANNEPRRKELGEHGRRRAELLFSEDEMVARYTRLYREMMEVCHE